MFQLHLDSAGGDPSSPQQTDVDFFKEHESEGSRLSNWESSAPTTQPQPVPISNGSIAKTAELADGKCMNFKVTGSVLLLSEKDHWD